MIASPDSIGGTNEAPADQLDVVELDENVSDNLHVDRTASAALYREAARPVDRGVAVRGPGASHLRGREEKGATAR